MQQPKQFLYYDYIQNYHSGKSSKMIGKQHALTRPVSNTCETTSNAKEIIRSDK